MKHTLVCLHGWGGSKESFTELREALTGTDLEILTPDLPGFGAEPEPEKPWTNDDYADWVTSKLEARNPKFEKFFILGHSHGGRIALKLAQRQSTTHPFGPERPSGPSNGYPLATSHFVIDHLFLCAPAGIRHPRHFKRIFGLTLAKTGKFFLRIPGMRALQPLAKSILYKLVRVHDYEHLSPIMRQTMINVAGEDLRPLLRSVKIATDLFWGKDDGMTPYSDALIMERELSTATLHTYPGVRHRVHRDRAQEIAKVIRSRMAHTA